MEEEEEWVEKIFGREGGRKVGADRALFKGEKKTKTLEQMKQRHRR